MGDALALLLHGLAPCKGCQKPVAAPVGLLDRELFHVSHCPHCGLKNPHPQEVAELRHTKRTAIMGGLVLVGLLLLVLAAPLEVLACGL